MAGTIDAVAILNSLDKRLYTVEQTISNPNAVLAPGGSPTFDSIIVGLPGDQVTIGTADPGAPQNLVLTTGAYYDQIYIDIDWDAPLVNASAVESYEIEVAKKIAGVYQLGQISRVIGTNFRYEPVEPDTTYGVRVYPVNYVGQRGTPVGFTDILSGHDLTVPPAVTNVTAFRGATSVIVKFDGLTAAQAPDVANGQGLYEIQVDTVNTFNSGNLRTMRSSATIVAFNDIITQGTWFARVSAIDQSGNQGAWVVSASATAGGVVDNMVVSGLDAAKITFGSMSGDRITVNTLQVNALLDASTMTAKTINIGSGGQFKIGNPTGGFGTSGIYINDQGIRLYKDGSPVVTLDAITGTGTFSGTVSGSQITGSTIIGGTIQTLTTVPTSGSPALRFGFAFGGIELFSGHASETTPGRLIAQNASGVPYVRIESPRLSGGGAPNGYIDLKGGSGSTSNILLSANDTIIASAGGVYLQYAGNTRLTVDANGMHAGSTLAMQNNPIYFRAYNDGNHYIFFYGGDDRLEYGTWVKHMFYTGGGFRMKIDTNGIHVQDYVSCWADQVRLGELYGRRGVYVVPGAGYLQLDSADAGVYITVGNSGYIECSGGYNYFWHETSMQRTTLFLRDAGDYNHRLYWHSGWDGPVLSGNITSAALSLAYDVVGCAGFNGSYWRCVNIGQNAWKDVAAANIAGYSDPRSKESPRTITKREALNAVRKVKPIRFEWKEGWGDNFVVEDEGTLAEFKKRKLSPETARLKEAHTKPPKTWMGLSSQEVPEDMQYDMPVEGTEDGKGINVMSAIAYLWGAVGDVADDQDERFNKLAAQIADLAKTVAALANK